VKPTVEPEGLLEHLALWTNLAPFPIVESMYGMMVCRVIMAGVRLGIYESLCQAPFTSEALATQLSLDAAGTDLLLKSLCSVGHLRTSNGSFSITRRAQKWLDPKSPTYIGAFLEFNYDQWEWWSKLENVVRSGDAVDIHQFGSNDPRWERYISAMFQLARLSAPEVAGSIRMPANPTRLLDLAGGHGWFAAQLCKRHPGLKATVLDLPGSAAIGRRIISDVGMSDRVAHVEGDLLTHDLGGPYDGVLAFQIIHHLTADLNRALFQRIRQSLKPGGVFAILDYFQPPKNMKPDAASVLGLHFFLTSASATFGLDVTKAWLCEAGFRDVQTKRLRSVPIQILIEAH
jgi:SAM-dependent methyltransferase